MTHIPIFELFDGLLAIYGRSYIKQRILREIIIETALNRFNPMNSF